MTAFPKVKVDAKGRIMISKHVREGLGIQLSNRISVGYDEERQEMRLATAENPFDVLVEHALAEMKAGRTRSLREFATENDFALAAGL